MSFRNLFPVKPYMYKHCTPNTAAAIVQVLLGAGGKRTQTIIPRPIAENKSTISLHLFTHFLKR